MNNMLKFYEEKYAETKKKLMRLFEERDNAGVGNKGDYDNIIAQTERNLEDYAQRIAKEKEKTSSGAPPNEKRPVTPPIDEPFVSKMKRLVMKDKLKTALIILTREYPKNHTFIMFLSRLNALMTQEQQGIMKNVRNTTQYNSIKNSLLQVLDTEDFN